MDAGAKARFQERVRALEAFGHRGSATDHEARAADYLVRELGTGGVAASKEEFSSCTSAGARLLVHIVIAAAGAALLWRWPAASIGLGLAALVSMVLEQGTRAELLGRFLLSATSRNVVARVAPAAGAANRRLVLVAHYDTQRTGFMWREGLVGPVARLLNRMPGMTKSPLFPVLLAMTLQALAGGVALAWPGATTATVLGCVALVIYLVSGLLLAEWTFGPFVPGASDNATGTAAVMALAEAWRLDPIAGVELVLVFTGSEEAGLLGATAFCRTHAAELATLPTAFLNLDSFGYGAPRFLGREHTLAGMPVSYPSHLVRLCGEVAADLKLRNAGPRSLPVAGDGIPFLIRGVPGMSILSFQDDGHMPNYHQLTDTSDRLDFDVAWQAVGFAWAVLRRMAEAT